MAALLRISICLPYIHRIDFFGSVRFLGAHDSALNRSEATEPSSAVMLGPGPLTGAHTENAMMEGTTMVLQERLSRKTVGALWRVAGVVSDV